LIIIFIVVSFRIILKDRPTRRYRPALVDVDTMNMQGERQTLLKGGCGFNRNSFRGDLCL